MTFGSRGVTVGSIPYWMQTGNKPGATTVTRRVRELGKKLECDVPLSCWRHEDASFLRPFDDVADRVVSNAIEGCNASTVGLATEYLSHVATGETIESAFRIAISASLVATQFFNRPDYAKAVEGYVSALHHEIESRRALSDMAIGYAMALSSYDVVYRSGPNGFSGGVNPRGVDPVTTAHIRRMVQRSWSWLTSGCLPGQTRVVLYGPSFDRRSFDSASHILAGDGDFVIASDSRGRYGHSLRTYGDSYAFCDFKCTAPEHPSAEYRLQLMVYWLLGLMDDTQPVYRKVDRIVVWNTRHGTAWWLDLCDVDTALFETIATQVIGYPQRVWDDDLSFRVNVALGVKSAPVQQAASALGVPACEYVEEFA